MEPALLTWRLTPAEKSSELWRFSTYQGDTWVRAHDAFEARALAAERFRQRIGATDRPSALASPWYMRELVRCDIVQDDRFASVAIAGVVHPAHEQFADSAESGGMPNDTLRASIDEKLSRAG
ncbi:MAG: hypothetical protein ABI612_14950 [Betaproteobacteria bacterium]